MTIRRSSELPDDVGTVFVTDVPGAAFQLLGRRGPTGELFVGTVITPRDECYATMAERTRRDRPSIEIVTGPEAEELIAKFAAQQCIPIPTEAWQSATPAPSLEALIRRLSRLAEDIFGKADGTTTMPMLWLLEAPEKQALFATGVQDELKDELAWGLRATFKINGVTRYACAIEAWMALTQNDQESNLVRPSLRPDRIEVIWITGEDGRGSMFALRTIIRPKGGKPYLGALGKIERPDGPVAGRFQNLLQPAKLGS